jgi:hypothetical protein
MALRLAVVSGLHVINEVLTRKNHPRLILIVFFIIFCYNEIEGRLVRCLQREEVLGLPLTGCILGHILKRPRIHAQLSLICLLSPAAIFFLWDQENAGFGGFGAVHVLTLALNSGEVLKSFRSDHNTLTRSKR